ncbi:MAG TPA: DUF3052 family protein [Actinomycetota bacterium]|nr:DUF3052 family protein [Actinomycetota bacterium]
MAAQKRTDYSGTPLYRKLGIKQESLVLLDSPPQGFSRALGRLPDGAELAEGEVEGAPDVVVMFVTRYQDLAGRFRGLWVKLAPAGGIWVAWPKKSSPIENDLSFELVQDVGLAAGLVDNKSCAIDHDWQGLRFVRRRHPRGVGGSEGVRP